MPVLPYGSGKSTSAGTGTVTSASVISANGLAGTVATATTTPAITLTTTVTGVLKGNATAISAAVAGTDYALPNANTTGTAANITGILAVAQGGTGATANTGTGSVVLSTSPTITTPAISGNMTVTGTNQDQGTNLQTIRAETSSDFVASGAVWTISSGLSATMTAGVVYIGGKRIIAGAIATVAFAASLDWYAYINNAGSINYVSVANNATSPALPANSIWLAIVVTGASAITSIRQGGVDSNSKVIYPYSPQISGQQVWIGLTYQNSWVDFGGTAQTGAYMKDSLGFVHLKGLMKSGTIGTVAFTLPIGFRPLAYSRFATVSSGAFGTADFPNTGAFSPTVGSNTSFSLDNITFRAEL